MEAISARLAHAGAERKRLERTVRERGRRLRLRRERALRVATIAFCHVPTAGVEVSRALLWGYDDCLNMDLDACSLEIEKRFLATPVQKLAQCLDWEADLPEAEVLEDI